MKILFATWKRQSSRALCCIPSSYAPSLSRARYINSHIRVGYPRVRYVIKYLSSRREPLSRYRRLRVLYNRDNLWWKESFRNQLRYSGLRRLNCNLCRFINSRAGSISKSFFRYPVEMFISYYTFLRIRYFSVRIIACLDSLVSPRRSSRSTHWPGVRLSVV